MTYLQHIFMMSLVFGFNVYAQPDAASKQVINDMVLYQDYLKKNQFYYVPYGLKLITNSEGKPQFKFIQMRYTGTHAYGDQGNTRFRSLLSFSVTQNKPTNQELDQVTDSLRLKGLYVKSLKPIPISNIKAILVHAADIAMTDSLKHTVSGGYFESSTNASQNVDWKERDFTMRLNNHDAQLFSESFQGNQPTLSVNYSYSSKLTNLRSEELTVIGNEGFVESMRAFATEQDSILQLQEVIVKSDALPITIDIEKWPSLIKKIDINSQIPSDYAALDVYCYDFNNNIRGDLFAKRIEIKAVGVGGNDVTYTSTFNAKYPDEYAKSIQFVYAVKLKEPYQYRISEIYKDGNFNRHDWVIADSWHQILDITTKPTEE
ncbi:hypothetical protein [Flavivirga spongiicola]|uniref:Uncharacterized protein n=1 Tax=Flavivirga spongiicola TaxID=421621 RepID=A0ABU7XPL2_9FLAO|nr:hypothetical protein [Flavivirga sp. MEBiC05379]MDO5981471.1 hypothetical protein [Flavivirga sp. MEBiC05379]